MKLATALKENKILAVLTLMIIIGVLTFDVYHYSNLYGVVELNSVTSLFLVPFIALLCGLGILLGTTKQQVEFEATYRNRITPREREVIDLIAQGKRNTEIAESLYIDISTVKSHINRIYRKCGVGSRKELLQLLELGVKKS